MPANLKKSSATPSYSKTLLIIVLCCFGALIYSNTFQSPFQFDDEHTIIENLSIRNLSNLSNISNRSRFITYLTFAVNYHFHQLNVFGYHLFNMIIHLGTAFLVWWLTLLTLSTPALRDNKITSHTNLIAFFVALTFVAHPVQVQAVTYITQRATSLVIFFYLAAVCFYVKWRLSLIKPSSVITRIYCFFGFIIAATLGMFTKELIVTLPLVILLYEICFLRIRDYFNWKYLVTILILIAIGYFIVVAPKIAELNIGKEAYSTEGAMPPNRYILSQFRVLVTYLRLFFVPINQNIDYDYLVAKTILEPPILASVFLLSLILFGAFKAHSKYRLISFGIFLFFVSLSQEFTIMPLYFFLVQDSRELIVEERLYLPMVGYSFFLVSAIYYIFGQKNIKRLTTILFIIISCYGILTYSRNSVWKEQFTLWNDAVHKSPKKARPYSNRGRAYAKRGDYDKAIFDFDKAIEIDPNFYDAYYNRGYLYKNMGNIEQAITDYTIAAQLYPDFIKAYYNRGNIYRERGDFDLAISDYSKAIEIDANYIKAYVNRGNTYKEKGYIDQAIADYSKAIEVNSDYLQPYYNRANVYNDRGDFDFAISDYNRAIEIDPNHVLSYYKRAVTYFRKQDYDKAWGDVHRLEALGRKIPFDFLEALKKKSGREE